MNTQPGRLLTEQEMQEFRAAWPTCGEWFILAGTTTRYECDRIKGHDGPHRNVNTEAEGQP